jgi:hypothetical protein
MYCNSTMQFRRRAVGESRSTSCRSELLKQYLKKNKKNYLF